MQCLQWYFTWTDRWLTASVPYFGMTCRSMGVGGEESDKCRHCAAHRCSIDLVSGRHVRQTLGKLSMLFMSCCDLFGVCNIESHSMVPLLPLLAALDWIMTSSSTSTASLGPLVSRRHNRFHSALDFFIVSGWPATV